VQSINKARFSVLSVALALGAGCGGGSSHSSTQTPGTPAAGTTPVQVSMGDAPADWIMAFGMSVTSITMTNSSRGTVNLLSSPVPMEMMNLTGTVQPLTMANIPQDTYTQATVTVSPISMGYIDPTTKLYVQKSLSGTYSGKVSFSPAMTIGSGASVLGIDMNMANSVSIDGSGNVTINPAFTAMMNPITAGSQSPWQGWMQGLVGSVSGTSGSQFTMTMLTGQQSVTFTTNSSTVFGGMGMSGMGSMSKGMIVHVDATTQADGSALATNVEAMDTGGMMAGGLVGNITGTPPTQFTMAANNGIGGGMMMSNIAGTMDASLSGSPTYSMDSDNVDLTNLPFTPMFNASTIAKGQKMDVVSGSSMISGGMGGGMMGGSSSNTVDASQVRLEQQGLRGTVSNSSASGSQTKFTLTMPADSAFATLAGTNTVTVYKQNGTQMLGTSTITNGSTMEVRGLLFNNSGTYNMVSTWIVAP
jgi:hypothetical protein